MATVEENFNRILQRSGPEHMRQVFRMLQLIIDWIERKGETVLLNPYIIIPPRTMHREGYVAKSDEEVEVVSQEIESIITTINGIAGKPIIQEANEWLRGDERARKTIEIRLNDLKKHKVSVDDIERNFTLRITTKSAWDTIYAIMSVIETNLNAVQSTSQEAQETLQVKIVEMPEMRIKGLDKLPHKTRKQTKENVLILNKTGDLYKHTKEKDCYRMVDSQERHKIVRHFAENKIYNYCLTNQLAMDLEKNPSSLMREIGKINALAQSKLKIRVNILDGKRGSGYRIHPEYKINLKDE